jgi:hypothetical protein
MKTASTLSTGRKITAAFIIALGLLNLFISTSASAQSKAKKKNLANVTFMDEYVRKANQAATEKAIMENLDKFTAPVVEKKAIPVRQLPDGRYLFYRPMQDPKVGDFICLTKTDADGNIVWERKFIGDGFSSQPDNFMKRTRDGGYLIQRTICSAGNVLSSALTAESK